MRLVNRSKVPDEKINEIFDFCAKPLGIKGMKVTVYDTEFHNGYGGSSFRDRAEILITTGGKNKSFPFFIERKRRLIKSKDRLEETKREIREDGRTYIYYRKKPGYVDKYREDPHLSMLFLTREELMLYLMAHELRHQWQHKLRPMKEYTFTVRHLNSRSYFRRERDCDAFALAMIRKWRNLHSVDIYPEQPDKLEQEIRSPLIIYL